MGRRRLCRRFHADEIVRGESNSRGHSQARIQNTPDQARDACVIDVRRDVFCFGLAPGPEIGLIACSAGERWIGLFQADDTYQTIPWGQGNRSATVYPM